MDLLKAEMKRKKEALAKAKQQTKKKYMKASDIRRMEEEEEEREREEKRRVKKDRKRQAEREAEAEAEERDATKSRKKDRKKRRKAEKEASSKQAQTSANGGDSSQDGKTSSSKDELTPLRITKQFRDFGLVVRYFGETHTQRIERLKQAKEQQKKKLAGLSEMEEFRLGKGFGIRNTFLEKDDMASKGKGKNDSDDEEDDDNDNDSGGANNDGNGEADYSDDPPKFIYRFLKGLLKDWEKHLSQRQNEETFSVQGRNETKTFKQCKDYIRPLFKLCKRRRIEPGMEAHLVKIVNHAKEGEFVKAHDAYLDVAIGRAAWPIGVTMVGIHARTGRAKIESSNVAHVMNSELQRKYLTSVKRLLTFAQKNRPDVDPSKKVC
uniref:Pre-mRNA-splicing factor 18 n=1 Tax=Craspedostauros australis TaxID=1486917 RepID=A0A7S0F5R2_9STRA|mmetsp:Transcript_7231/g.19599  ORF Transcript_7231/g.19599 Transcript_7231/m.19599 type:complete len:379 (+) Transcript_7231:219-1355(+)|eukprot:CAMPEP_0198126398 /NCGR_PEP_ID=MMETSP1442-20131203/44724_1 /TAXON_ID= /ORGANISM="Craspedostauros australis, Strain CCMP3328" /LENGTH=378 /DNA_ID=CAMNT_0043786177 /DNA_START=145 /DNA_END=1281 /DNA_ORIENTATION=+